MLKNFIYRGPISSITIKEGDTLSLIDGDAVTLPDDHPQVVALLERKHLELVSPKPGAAITKAEPAASSPPSKRGQGAR